ncbi:DUF4411 family protein [Staphylococcus saprophyticus]|uniref:DUF4411 family protein n=1 Tax=Staphylococcus saprophyticus TaxID=29385 RepID=UPI000E67C479|nr:DUF4411 family protein [Staphylococcus saprophyticus]RIO37293.1 DUF4411 family protein [Staphylococcus saprophyticus]WMM14378.1 DUF4411 family protein [Staphylococcus saprophyticus]
MGNSSKENFILDSNCFITPSKQFYSFDLVPTFWNCLKDQNKSQYIHIIDRIKDELCHETVDDNKDDVQKWVELEYNGNILTTDDEEILENYAEILNHVQNSGKYKESALEQWSNIKIADPWLIATAKKFDYTIVTFETGQNLQIKNKAKAAKIPNVCDHFGVKYCTLYEMMHKLNIKI